MTIERKRINSPRELTEVHFQSLVERDQRGKTSELRAKAILDELVVEGFFDKVSKGTKKQDRKGVDFFGHIRSSSLPLKIPIQVKSSAVEAQEFRHQRGVKASQRGIIVVVVNKTKSDEEVKDYLRQSVSIHWSRRIAISKANA